MGFLMKRVGLVPASFIVSFVIVTYGEYKKNNIDCIIPAFDKAGMTRGHKFSIKHIPEQK